jgi:type I restriction enzyme R subunit
MNNDNFIVRPHLEYVERFKKREEWDILTDTKVSDITTHISKLPSEKMDDDHDAKRWDLVMLQTQLALVNKNPQFKKLVTKIQSIAKSLEDLVSIPDVKKNIALIESIADPVFWEGMNLTVLEEIREKLRELIKYIEASKKANVYSSFTDGITDIETGVGDLSGGNDLIQYRKKMEAKIRENENHITINKLKHNKPITQADLDELDRILFEDEDDKHKFEDVFGSSIKDKVGDEDISLGVLIRSIVGLNLAEIEELFSEFIQKASLSSVQQKFVDQVIQFMVRDGVVPMSKLYEPPFSDIHEAGVDGVFGQVSDELVGMIEEFNQCYLSA